jgi:hypothetical protein
MVEVHDDGVGDRYDGFGLANATGEPVGCVAKKEGDLVSSASV